MMFARLLPEYILFWPHPTPLASLITKIKIGKLFTAFTAMEK
jgi:hypothetical protein